MKNTVLFLMISCSLALFSCRQGQAPQDKNTGDILQEENTLIEEMAGQNNISAIREDLSGQVQILSDLEFVEKITEVNNPKGFQYKGKTPCIVNFYADWCGPCTRMIPMYTELAKKYQGQVIFYKLNTDKSPGIALAFNINSIPTLLLMKPDGQPTRIVGAPTLEELEKAIQTVLLPQ
ncbi:MAG: conjugal transfer protein TraF [Bacteroidales bacterium]|jgi:thioredoxin|nr:conjugal transfer protein TraF [Bacteroidales bacterium]